MADDWPSKMVRPMFTITTKLYSISRELCSSFVAEHLFICDIFLHCSLAAVCDTESSKSQYIGKLWLCFCIKSKYPVEIWVTKICPLYSCQFALSRRQGINLL